MKKAKKPVDDPLEAIINWYTRKKALEAASQDEKVRLSARMNMIRLEYRVAEAKLEEIAEKNEE